MNGKKPQTFYELYPMYLTEEVKKEQEKQKMQLYLEQLKAFAEAHNNRIREEGV